MGVEHGNEKYRAEVLHRKMTNESIVQAFALCKKYGFKTKAHQLVGLPYETPELHRDTIQITADIQPDSFNLHIFEPYPGTHLGDIWPVKENLIDPEREKLEFVGQTDTDPQHAAVPARGNSALLPPVRLARLQAGIRSSKPFRIMSITRGGASR